MAGKRDVDGGNETCETVWTSVFENFWNERIFVLRDMNAKV